MTIGDYYREVIDVVETLTGVTEGQIIGKCKAREFVDARWLVAKLMRDGGYYPRQIALQMGVSVRWVQKIIECFQDRVRYSSDPTLRINWEEAAKILRIN